MNILHISTYSEGGAGIAALRLHKSLIKIGIDSKFLCLVKAANIKNVEEVYEFESVQKPLYQRFLTKFELIKTNRLKNLNLIQGNEGNYEIFSFPATDFKIHLHPLVKEADIINLHWVANFLDYPSFFKNIKKPIVWTLHDANPFLGGFHLEEDVQNNKLQMGEIESSFMFLKEKILNSNKNITVVTPSSWLGAKSQSSISFKGKNHFVIPNGIDEQIFRNYNKDFLLKKTIRNNSIAKLLFVGQTLKSKNKGFDLLMGALDFLDLSKLELWVIGESEEMVKGSNIVYLGSIADENMLAMAYSYADAFIIPSRNENLPNVMLESLVCGTPVISFNVGGMAEVIKDGVNGVIADEISSESLAKAILKFIDNREKFSSITIRQNAIKLFSSSLQSESYRGLYYNILRDFKYY